MKWFLIDKVNSKQPAKGNYPDWKEQIAEECRNQCIYCAIHESQFGGQRNFHVEHYKPKSLFEDLKKDIKNLYYACGICNTFKGDDWNGDWTPGCTTLAYPDPSLYDYGQMFSFTTTYELIGKSIVGKYIINKLHLNRAQLIIERRAFELFERYSGLNKEVTSLLTRIIDTGKVTKDRTKSDELIKAFLLLNHRVSSLNAQIHDIRPYTANDVKR